MPRVPPRTPKPGSPGLAWVRDDGEWNHPKNPRTAVEAPCWAFTLLSPLDILSSPSYPTPTPILRRVWLQRVLDRGMQPLPRVEGQRATVRGWCRSRCPLVQNDPAAEPLG